MKKKKLYVWGLTLLILFFGGIPKAFADTHIENLSLGSWTRTSFPSENVLGKWGVTWETRTQYTSNYKGAGKAAIKIKTYYTRQTKSWGTNKDIVNKGTTYLVDSYNEKTYTYNTYCELLYTPKTLSINKTVGWKSSANPYINYPLKPGTCYGSPYANVNHIFVNAK
ncbi:hypothetical protein P4V29_33895 [Bacillus thuringiensis]|nr:hypothetical protein [Bacillus thuringiensis]MED1757278.1 hypothetical protein [Bacillus thuringiensis]